MRRSLLAAGGFALLAAPLVVVAQPPGVNRGIPGYMVIRVNLASTPAAGIAGPGGLGGEGGGPGGPPGPGGPGRGGPGGLPGGFGGPPGGTPQVDDGSRSVVVVVPYTKLDLNQPIYPKLPKSLQNPPIFPKITGPNNAYIAYLYNDNDKVILRPLPAGNYLPSILDRRHTDWARQRNPLDGRALVADALACNQPDRALKFATEVATAVANRKDTPTPLVAEFVKAFNVNKDALAKPLPANPEAEKWRERLGAEQVVESDHYAAVTFGERSIPRESVNRRLTALESNYKSFYLWHALGGAILPPPPAKLLVVIADKATDLPRLNVALDGNPMAEAISDGFYSPVHSLVVMSPERRDEIGRAWVNYFQKYTTKGYNRDELLKGNPPQPTAAIEGALDVALVSTLSLVDKMVDDEAVTAMASRDGSRQLFAVTGKLNGYVILPEWVEQGASNLLNKPKGPYFHKVDNQPKMTVAIRSGFGAANYVLAREFAKLQAAKELNPDPATLLMNTLMDKYFDAYREGKDIDPPPPAGAQGGQALGGPGGQPGGLGGPPGGFPGRGGPPGGGFGEGGEGEGGAGPGGPPGGGFGAVPDDREEKARQLKVKLMLKSQVTAWGLNYFLALKKTPALFKFYAALSRMPRDMRLDRQLVLNAFCKEFDLMDLRDTTRINQDEFKKFAADWVTFLSNFVNEGLELDVGGTAGQAGPGGFPGLGGPGGGPGRGGSPDGGGP
jgi:hypothetical protein